MGTPNQKVSIYIDNARPFAQPILDYVRELIHEACPDVTESIKWGMPCFEHAGPMITIAGFKEHCVVAFWKSQLLEDPGKHLLPRSKDGGNSMGNLGKIKTLKDLPPKKAFVKLIKQAAKVNELGLKVPKKSSVTKEPLPVPAELDKLLLKNKEARQFFTKLTPAKKREFIEWITGAKMEATRLKRIDKTIELLEEGKSLNWKYETKRKA